MRNTTSSTIGTMSRLSWAAAASKSFCCAVGPPTSAVGLAACAAPRKSWVLVRPLEKLAAPEAAHAEQHSGGNPYAAGTGGDAFPDSPPESVRLVGALGAQARDEGPEGAPAADDQPGREQGEHREHGQRHAHGADRPESAGAVDLGQRQAEQRDDHRRA